MRQTVFVASILFLFLLFPSSAFATDYYIGPDANLDGSTPPTILGNDANSGTLSQPWKTFNRAFNTGQSARLQPGDTLILFDGIYYQTIDPPYGGQDGQRITIAADHDGKAIIDGQKVRDVIVLLKYKGAHYFEFDGIVGRNGNNVPDGSGTVPGNGHIIRVETNYNIFKRISAYNASADANSAVISLAAGSVANPGARYNLIEDCIVAGTGRKMIDVHDNYNTVRRCFSYGTDWDGRFRSNSWPNLDEMQIYNASNNIFENIIAYGSTPTWSISVQANVDAVSAIGNKILGSIAMNAGMHPDGTIRNWGCTLKSEPCNCVQFDGLQVANIAPSTLTEYYWCRDHGNVSESNGTVTFNFADRPQPVSSIAYNLVRDFDWPGQRSAFYLYGQGTITDNLFRDIFAYNNASMGFGTGMTGTQSNNRLEYATIVNSGIDAPTADGGKGMNAKLGSLTVDSNTFIENTQYQGSGARLSCKYIDGVLQPCDPTNSNDPNNLWPWPMEDRIRSEFADAANLGSYAVQGFSVTNTIYPILAQYGALDEPVITPTPTPSESVYFTARDSFYNNALTFQLTDPLKIQQAQDIIQGNSPLQFPFWLIGTVVKDPIWYNSGWSFHLDPATIDFSEVTIEVCQTSVQGIEDNLDAVCGKFLPNCLACIDIASLNEVVLPGDTDGDSDVDIFDYNAVITDFGRTGGQGFSAADFDGDGDVDIFDYNVVISNFGR